MKFFLDTADINEIKELASIGLVDGVTTNPSIIAKSGRNINEVISEIATIIDGDISAEVISTDFDGMIKEADLLSKLGKNIVIKLPCTLDGMKACNYLSKKNVKTNMTLCFSASQALLVGKLGATYVSPFVGRLDDISSSGMSLIDNIRTIYNNYGDISTEILVASVRSPVHVVDAALIGADVVTLPPSILRQLINHPLTDKGLDQFLKDWNQAAK